MPLLALALCLLLADSARAAAPWRWPVRGDILTPFHVGPNPFARGQHRGIDIAAAAGARVRSACAGRVRFAGRLPRQGLAVSVACGPLVATYLELGSVAVGRGDAVGRGAPVGTVAASHVHLGARRAVGRRAYLNPLDLLGEPDPPPLGAAPTRRPRGLPPERPPLAPPERAPLAPPERPPLAAPHRAPLARPQAAPAGAPVAAWAGLALLLAGTPLGALWRRGRRRREVHARDPAWRPR